MFTAAASMYSLEGQTRALNSVRASKDNHRFIVGTCSLHEANALNLLEFQEDSNTLQPLATYSHDDQIMGIETSCHDDSLVLTSWLNKENRYGITLWRLVDNSYGDDHAMSPTKSDYKKLDHLGDIGDQSSSITNVKWHKLKDNILSANRDKISIWTVAGSDIKLNTSFDMKSDQSGVKQPLHLMTSLAWDPHSTTNFAVGKSNNIHIYDSRKMENATSSISEAHDNYISDLDYNPNKPNILLSSGYDRTIKCWDLRQMTSPLKILEGHMEGVTCVKYNPFHDQLILSGGLDNNVSLWRIATTSSAPWLSTGDDDDMDDIQSIPTYLPTTTTTTLNTSSSSSSSSFSTSSVKNVHSSMLFPSYYAPIEYRLPPIQQLHQNISLSYQTQLSRLKDPADIKVRHFDQHEDSVYNVAWSAADAWVYCSLSYDGRVFVNHVPSTEKYKILL